MARCFGLSSNLQPSTKAVTIGKSSDDSVRTSTNESVRVRVVRTLEEVEQIRSVWMAWPEHRDADIDVFLTVLRCEAEGAEPHIIVIERNGRPDAIVVGMLTVSNLRERIAYVSLPISNVRTLSFAYRGFLGKQTEENCNLVLNEIERSLRRREADIALLGYVREDSPLYQVAARPQSVWTRGVSSASQTHWKMNITEAQDGIFATISGDHKRKLRAEAKKFRAAFSDLEVVRFEGSERFDVLMNDAEQVAATTYQRALGAGFSNTKSVRDLLALEAEKGWLRAYILYFGGRPGAFWIGSVYNGVFLSEYLAHDPAHAKFSPGTFLLMQAMEEFQGAQITGIDFGIGDALYKQRFSNQHWKENTLSAYAPTWVGMRVKAIRNVAALVDSTAKNLLGAKLTGRVKKMWRDRLSQKSSSQHPTQQS
jgi:CelD/BcsL family acetyltransferase involved in cellulose biosynthesis